VARFTKGTAVEVHFLDHVQDGDKPYEFVVFGRVANVDRRSVTVESWTYVDTKERDKTNVTRFVICKSTITRWYRLERS